MTVLGECGLAEIPIAETPTNASFIFFLNKSEQELSSSTYFRLVPDLPRN